MENEKRLIDANALMDAFRNYMVERHDRLRCASEENCKVCERECLWRRVIKNAPTVDAVEVVRCKDCLWFDYEDELPDVFRSEQHCYCTEANTYVPINHFCSYGERRTDA